MNPTTTTRSRSGKPISLACAAGSDFKVAIAKTRLTLYGAPLCPCHNEKMEAA